MDVARVLLDILVVLVAAKVAAEGAERLGVPAVVGEIIAGVLVGPSVLGLVGGDDEVLRVLGELGVILLLLDVGLEMDIGELTAVGRAALSVAVVGVILPLVGGMGAAMALGMDSQEALFIGAALTATSVGITARVFGDLRILATPEARTVLGAAVADDVMGLVILTVVTRIAAEGSVSAGTVITVILVAVGFLTVATVAGVRLAPWLFEHVSRISRAPGTVMGLALAFTLAMAELANEAKLAPIVGAFVAGLALSRGAVAPRIRRELAPIGQLLIPVFFLGIGIDADVGQLADVRVLGIAAALMVVAVAGKIVAGIVVGPNGGDRLLIGLAMIPRGEVGLIFATLGLSQGILGDDLYASLLVVVLGSTLVTPPLLTWRSKQLQQGRLAADEPEDAEPEGGWLRVGDEGVGPVELAAHPPSSAAAPIALQAALAVGRGHRAGDRLVRWLGDLPDEPLTWDAEARRRLAAVLALGDARAWRFLLVTGFLDRALPELAEPLRRRREDPFEIDPTRAISWPRLTRVNLTDPDGMERPDLVRLAALLLDASDADPDVEAAAHLVEPVARRIGLDESSRADLSLLVEAATLLPAASRRLDGLDEEPVLQLAGHLRRPGLAEMAWTVAATTPVTQLDMDRLDTLRELVTTVLEHPDATAVASGDFIAAKRAEAAKLIPDAAERIAVTPRAFVLSQAPGDLARQASLANPPVPKGQVRAAVSPTGEPGVWRLDVALADRIGLMAGQLAALRDLGFGVLDVATVVWPDRQSLSSFRVTSPRRPNGDTIADAIATALPAPTSPMILPGAEVTFDSESSPWHTICTVHHDSHSDSLLAVAKAVALCDLNVVAARAVTDGDDRRMVLELTDRSGRHPDPGTYQRILNVLLTGQRPGGRRRTGARA